MHCCSAHAVLTLSPRARALATARPTCGPRAKRQREPRPVTGLTRLATSPADAPQTSMTYLQPAVSTYKISQVCLSILVTACCVFEPLGCATRSAGQNEATPPPHADARRTTDHPSPSHVYKENRVHAITSFMLQQKVPSRPCELAPVPACADHTRLSRGSGSCMSTWAHPRPRGIHPSEGGA